MNLLMGAVKGLSPRVFIPFMNSAYNFHFGDLVVFVPDDEPETLKQFNRCDNAVTVPHPPVYDLPVNAYRYFLYREYLKEHDCENVMIADMRDVIFQSDPFSAVEHDGRLHVFHESVLFGNDMFNDGWVEKMYGANRLEILRGCPVSCSGVTLGPRAVMLDYLEKMCEEIGRLFLAELLPRPPFFAGFDQGIHNVLVHNNPTVKHHDNGDGVLTLLKVRGGLRLHDWQAAMDGMRPAAVLHQYDRMKDKEMQFQVIFRSAAWERYARGAV